MGFVKHFVRVLLAAALGVASHQSLVFAACPQPRIDETAKVAYVYDGDTVRLKDGRHIRLIGINTPELAHKSKHRPTSEPTQDEPLARKARQAVIRLLGDSGKIGLQFGEDREDRYHRALAHIFLADGSSLEIHLLEAGLATTIAIPPNIARLDCYLVAERQARKSGLGIWRDPYYRPLAAASVTSGNRGYHRVRGIVEHVGRSRKSVWLDFTGGFSARIPLKDLTYFGGIRPEHWLKREITVRGWISSYRGEALMTIRHPAQIETDDDDER
ncbi:MAG: thermonuclease family protein [Gammaproteobacteria bacterium]|nr:thermonuclease family protein [Gammaproteobacteria bacterium]